MEQEAVPFIGARCALEKKKEPLMMLSFILARLARVVLCLLFLVVRMEKIRLAPVALDEHPNAYGLINQSDSCPGAMSTAVAPDGHLHTGTRSEGFSLPPNHVAAGSC